MRRRVDRCDFPIVYIDVLRYDSFWNVEFRCEKPDGEVMHDCFQSYSAKTRRAAAAYANRERRAMISNGTACVTETLIDPPRRRRTR